MKPWRQRVGNLKKVRLIRTVHGEQQSQVLDLSPTLRGENTQAFYVKDGDVIFVPTKSILDGNRQAILLVA